MARSTWGEACTKAERASLDYFKSRLTIKSGARSVNLSGILDTSQDRNDREKAPDGAFPIFASLACWRDELGFLPVVGEAMRIAETAKPDEEQLYRVVSVDTAGDLLVVEMQASTSNASPFFK